MSDRIVAVARSLRSAFDQSFAESPPVRSEMEDLLAITVGEDAYAVRLDLVAGLYADRVMAPYPSRASGSLGVVALRGVVTPVYDLRALLGHAGGPPPRWLLVARAAEAVALAFDRFDAYLRVDRAAMPAAGAGEHARRFVAGTVESGGVTRLLIDVEAVLANINRASEP